MALRPLAAPRPSARLPRVPLLLLLLPPLLLLPNPCRGDLISASWSNLTRALATLPTLQVVPTPLFERGSATHDAIWGALSALNASRVRFVPWLPFPRLGVAELEPPSNRALCGFRASSAANGSYFPLVIDCGASSIVAVDFAAYGESSGYCGSLVAGACVLPSSAEVVAQACVGKSSCELLSTDEYFGGNPGCRSGRASLAVQVRCDDAAQQHTSWCVWVRVRRRTIHAARARACARLLCKPSADC
jgi:hypothetical protein